MYKFVICVAFLSFCAGRPQYDSLEKGSDDDFKGLSDDGFSGSLEKGGSSQSFGFSNGKHGHGGYTDYSAPAKYLFEYGVKDDYGNNFGHREARDKDVTKGMYYVHLPDGRIQKVTYYVDGYSGFVADISYEGEAHHPVKSHGKSLYH